MQNTKFRIKGASVQQLLAGAGSAITARVIANMLIAQYGAHLSDMITRELEAKRSKLSPDAAELWPAYDFGLDLKLSIPTLGWMPPLPVERSVPRYEDQPGAVTVPQTEG